MKDIFNANMLCDKCNIKTDKKIAIKEGFKLRFFECPQCKEKWYHPTDMKEYQEFKALRQRHFDVKLRMVGNSFSVTIPREIIEFEEKFEKEINNMMRLSLEEPGKLSIRFRKVIR
jgi:hypothetical protein